METGTLASDQCKPTLSGSSFRLRSRSLNAVRLRRIFDNFDKNNDSFITVDEISQALSLLGLQTEFTQLESMVQEYIQPGNPGLTYEDFEAFHRSLDDIFFGSDNIDHGNGNDKVDSDAARRQEESDLLAAFNVFDENGDGYISARELQAVLGKLDLLQGREMHHIQMMISSVDRNRDGRVDFSEFKDMMHSVVIPPS